MQRGTRHRVILADYTYPDILTRLLAWLRCDVTVLNSADALLDHTRDAQFDLVLTRAVFQPGTNGFAMAREFLASQSQPTPLIIFSPYAEDWLVERLGPVPDGVVFIPQWTVQQLVDAVRALLRLPN